MANYLILHKTPNHYSKVSVATSSFAVIRHVFVFFLLGLFLLCGCLFEHGIQSLLLFLINLALELLSLLGSNILKQLTKLFIYSEGKKNARFDFALIS